MSPIELFRRLASEGFPSYPAQRGWWTASGKRNNAASVGQIKTFDYPAREGDVRNVLNVDHFSPPQMNTIQLDRQRVGRGTNGNADWRARIVYGCGGATDSFECDWKNGTQISLVCTNIAVAAVAYRPDPSQAYDPQGQTALMAAFGSYPSSANARPTLTRPFAVSALGAAQSFQDTPPPFAQSVRVIGSEPGPTPADIYSRITVRQVGDAGGFFFFAQGTDTLWNPIPLVAGSNAVQVSINAGNAANIALQYELGV